MSCGIDDILKTTRPTLEKIQRQLVEELALDYDLEWTFDQVANTREAKALQGALEQFAVWLIHDRARNRHTISE